MQRRIFRAILWAPAAAAALFLLVMLVNQGELRAGLNAHADFASAPLLAELVGEAPPGSTIVLGDYAWYEAFWLLRVTAWLPFHHFIWQLVPFALWLGAAALAGFSVRRFSGSLWAGATTAALVICGGVGMRITMWSLNTHGPAAIHAALVAAALALALTNRRWLHGVRGWVGALLLGLVTAVGATDPIVLLVAVGPLVASILVLGVWKRDLELARMGAFVAVLAVVGAKVLDQLAINANITWTHKQVSFVAGDQLMEKLEFLPDIVTRNAAGEAFGQLVGASAGLTMAAGLLAMVASVTVLITAVRLFKRSVWADRYGLVPAAGPITPGADPVAEAADQVANAAAPDASSIDAPPLDDDTGRPAKAARLPSDPESIFVGGLVFWFSVIALNLVAFIFTSAAFDVTGGRYLVAAWVGICVLIPLLAVRLDLRWLAAATASVLCFASLVTFVREPNPIASSGFPTEGLANEVEKFTKANGAEYGYAGFWDAAPITWHSRFNTRAYPILGCGTANCRFYQHYIDDWYVPKAGRSYLVVDPAHPLQPNVDPRYGRPVAQTKIGPVAVYVFDHDIAREFG